VTTDLSFTSLILNASLVVQLVLVALLLASLASWAIIFQKRRLLREARAASDDFEHSFWSGGDLSTMYKRLTSRGDSHSGMERIFEAGFREFGRLRSLSGAQAESLIESARRAMRVSQMKEIDRLEQSLSTLATVGSTSPYVGLFGTVWGIMNSFQAIAVAKDTSLAVIAPGLAEALFTTAMGLIVAIPAVAAYNKFSTDMNRYAQRLDGFAAEFTAILSRQLEEAK